LEVTVYVPFPLILLAGLLISGAAALIVMRTINRRRDLHDTSRVTISRSATLPPEVAFQVRALLSHGRKIAAVKLVRRSTTLDLKEARSLIERLN
jgi:ribosomal protein L7/L12